MYSQQKIDGVEERLSTLTEHIRSLEDTLTTSTTNSRHCSPKEHDNTAGRPTLVSVSAAVTPSPLDPSFSGFEGASSLHAHTRFANDFVQRTLRNGGAGSISLDRDETLLALKHLSTAAKPPGSPAPPHSKPPAEAPIPNHKLELPPFSAVAILLKEQRGKLNVLAVCVAFCLTGQTEKSSLSFNNWLAQFITIDALTQYSMDVYFVPSSCTDYLLIIVTAHLRWLFTDRMLACGEEEASSADADRNHVRLCQNALEAVIARLPLTIHPTLDAVHALVFAVGLATNHDSHAPQYLTIVQAYHAADLANASLTWTLACKAYELCQALGLHRSAASGNEDLVVTHRKRSLFWMLYMLDKGLSLRLGRSSNIQDRDIEINPDFSAAASEYQGYARHLSLSVVVCRLQARVYEELYSPHALSLPADARKATNNLVREVETVRQDVEQSIVRTSISA